MNPRVLAALLPLTLLGCPHRETKPDESIAPEGSKKSSIPSATAKASASVVASAAPSTSASGDDDDDAKLPPPKPSTVGGPCLVDDYRKGVIEAAWVDADRVYYCEKPSDSPSPVVFPGGVGRACSSMSLTTGERKDEPPTTKPPKDKKAWHGFPSKPLTKPWEFTMKEGLRTPHGTKATFTDTSTKKSKTAEVSYDEHVVFDGWIGDAVVLRQWVEEGPGCVRSYFDPSTQWPIDVTTGHMLPGCYGVEDLVYPTTSGVAIVDTVGSTVGFVDAKTLAVTSIATGHAAEIDSGNVVEASWDPPTNTLVLVYGAPVAGDVARVDLEKRTVTGSWTPPLCTP